MKQERKSMLLGAASVMLAFAGVSAQAQETNETSARSAPASSEEIVVLGAIAYRNRSDEIAPVLQYGLDYFQRFEPLTAGDALKRVPSVAFLSDVLESDGVRLRGLDPAYTQILINGEQVPGSGDSSGAFGNGADGAFFVDRIPAELIERVEVVRSQSANRSGDAVAGAINIVLRDSYSLDGGYVRAGGLYWANDEKWGGTVGGVWGGDFAGGRLLVGANMQDRHNPKDKFSERFSEPGGEIDDAEAQTDVRDGTDYSANFSYQVEAGGELSIDGFFVHTDRLQDEDSIGYDEGVQATDSISYINDNNVDIQQDSYALNGRYAFEMFGGETRVKLGYAQFENSAFEYEDEASYDGGPPNAEEFESEILQSDLQDEEIKAKLEHEREIEEGFTVEFGLHWETKTRDNLVLGADRGSELGDADFPDPLPFGGAFVDRADLEPLTGGDNSIERTRLDPYLMFTRELGDVDFEVGIRYETTDLSVTDNIEAVTVDHKYHSVLPSAHVTWNLTEADRIHVSVARTTRNPSFDFLSPALLEEELGDHDFLGNPLLKPEQALGGDIGYERRLGRSGVFGVNYFYRDIKDLIEIYNTGVLGSNDEGIYSARNTGDGQVWGLEFDLSAPLTLFGLEDTGVFVNYSWLDSKIDDEFGARMFNSQADSVFNVGFIQDLKSLGASFGATYRDQGEAYSRVVGEEVTTNYGPDLEIFVEKRIGERFTIRLTGSNLLDESKDETFDKFDNFGDQVDRDYDEYEIESETAGPAFQLVGRYAF